MLLHKLPWPLTHRPERKSIAYVLFSRQRDQEHRLVVGKQPQAVQEGFTRTEDLPLLGIAK